MPSNFSCLHSLGIFNSHCAGISTFSFYFDVLLRLRMGAICPYPPLFLPNLLRPEIHCDFIMAFRRCICVFFHIDIKKSTAAYGLLLNKLPNGRSHLITMASGYTDTGIMHIIPASAFLTKNMLGSCWSHKLSSHSR